MAIYRFEDFRIQPMPNGWIRAECIGCGRAKEFDSGILRDVTEWARRHKKQKNQAEWYLARRRQWFAANGPCVDCQSWDDLELDHVDPATKDPVLRIRSNVWTWTEQRRLAELAKCVARCKRCHQRKSGTECAIGEANGQARLTAADVRMIRTTSAPVRVLAGQLGVAQNTIWEARVSKTWKHLAPRT